MASERVCRSRIALSATAEFSRYPPSTEQISWAVTSLNAPLCETKSLSPVSDTLGPVDIVAVIDKSSSMSGNKLELVKKTLLFIVNQLKECDRLSLVTYDTHVYLEFAITSMDEGNKETLRKLIQGLVGGSSTNLCGGLIKGMEQLAFSTRKSAQVQSVWLLTDGQANIGTQNKDGILAEMRKLQDIPHYEVTQKKFEGTVYTFGFGSDHDSTLLKAISTQGGGMYYYIDSHEKIPQCFADCLGGLLTMVGQNLSLRLEAFGTHQIISVHTDKTVDWTTPNKRCNITMGDLQFEEERNIVLELKLPALPTPQTCTVLTASLSYFNVISSSHETCSCELTTSRMDGERGSPSLVVDTQKNRIITAAALKESNSLANQGKLSEARTVLTETIAKLESSVTAQNEYCKALADDLQTCLDMIKTREEYASHGKLYMDSKSQAHSMQRSNFVDDHTYYQSQAKMAFRAEAKK